MNLLPEPKLYLFLYLILACPALYIFSIVTPPFHVPDEPAHFARAFHVYKLNLFPQKILSKDGKSYMVGGEVDRGIEKLDQVATSIAFDTSKKFSAELRERANTIQWGRESWRPSANVSIYPPFFYIPAAVAISFAKSLDLSIADSVTVARWCNITVGLIIASLAILLSGHCAFFTTSVLLFPMVLSQMASASQDALLLPVSALFTALLLQLHNNVTTTKVALYALSASFLLFMLASSRPPYTALGLLIFATALTKNEKREQKILFSTALITIVSCFLWAGYVARYVSVPIIKEGVSYSQQIHFILENPNLFLGAISGSVQLWLLDWLAQIIGMLGWLDTVLPEWYYKFALVSFTLAILFFLFVDFFRNGPKLSWYYRMLVTAVLAVSCFGLLLVMYVVWTPVGFDKILGIQGRYFLPILFASSLLLYSPPEKNDHGPTLPLRSANFLFCLVAFSGSVGIGVSIVAIVIRFYP